MNNEKTDSYRDIIDLPHHVSPTRRRMPLRDRAAQFAPFAALTGYDDAVRETARQTEGWQDLYDDEKESMEETLRLLVNRADQKPEAEAVYFVRDPLKDGGSFKTVSGRVKKVDAVEKILVFEDGTEVPLADLVELELV